MTKKAYSVTDPDPYEAGSCIVFANTDIEARKRGADVLNLDEIGGLKCKREPWADQYEAENKIPATEMLAHGWALMCRGCEQLMEDGGYVTPVECVGEYATFISRVREDPTVDNGLSLWCVSDNLRKGAALNAVQIAELLGRRHLQKAA